MSVYVTWNREEERKKCLRAIITFWLQSISVNIYLLLIQKNKYVYSLDHHFMCSVCTAKIHFWKINFHIIGVWERNIRFRIISMQIWKRKRATTTKSYQVPFKAVVFFLHNTQLCKITIVFAVRNIKLTHFMHLLWYGNFQSPYICGMHLACANMNAFSMCNFVQFCAILCIFVDLNMSEWVCVCELFFLFDICFHYSISISKFLFFIVIKSIT